MTTAVGASAAGSRVVGPLPLRASAAALLHEVVPAGLMASAVLAGHTAVTMTAAALALMLLSFGYAPLARSRHWAREHLADLWAMVLLMVAMVFAGGHPAPGGGRADVGGTAAHEHGVVGVVGAAPAWTAVAAGIAVVGVWLIARTLLARRAWRLHSLVSLALCGSGLVWMLLL